MHFYSNPILPDGDAERRKRVQEKFTAIHCIATEMTAIAVGWRISQGELQPEKWAVISTATGEKLFDAVPTPNGFDLQFKRGVLSVPHTSIAAVMAFGDPFMQTAAWADKMPTEPALPDFL